MKVALIHDWLTGMRGGEKVLESLCRLYPDADIVTLLHVRGSVSALIEQRRIRRSFVQYLPLARRKYRGYLLVFPLAVELLNLDEYDLVISSSHCAAKAIVRPGRARHLCYCHSPMRYAWDQFDAYFGVGRVGPMKSALLRRAMRRMARWDATTASRVDRFVANSEYVARRIRRYYNRVASVVYPPVDTEFFHPDAAGAPTDTAACAAETPTFLIVSALVPYKRIDVAIAACREVGAELKIAGDGPELPRLRGLGDSRVEFLGPQPADVLRQLYRACDAVLLPGEEDFGIVPLEAQACGKPVVALGRGGVLETVRDGVTGVLVQEDTVEAFTYGLRRAITGRFDAAALRENALTFSRERFEKEIATTIDAMMAAPPDAARC